MKKQNAKQVTDLDDTFQKYLKKAKEYDKLTEARKKIRLELDDLDVILAPFLQKMEHQKQSFHIKSELCDVYGDCIGLQLVSTSPTVYLNKQKIFQLLYEFYTKKFPNQSKEDLKKFANSSMLFIYENKGKKPKKLRIKTIYRKEDSNKEDDEEDDDDEDEEEDSDE